MSHDPSVESAVARALAEAGVQIVDLDAEGALVRLGEGPEHSLRFSNLRRSLAVSPPDAAPAVIARFVRLWIEQIRHPPAAPSDAPRDLILPRLLAPGSADGGLGAPWVEPLAEGHLLLGLCVNGAETTRMVKLLDFPRWGLSVADTKARALARLEQGSASLAAELAGRADPLAPAELSLGDGYDAARLLIAHRWFPAARGLLAVAPCRDLLLVAPVADPATRDRALAVALRWRAWAASAVHSLPYPLSPQLFWRSEGLLAVLPVTDGPRATLHVPPEVARAMNGVHA